MRLGIDFGTTRTVVASVDDGNYPICTFNFEGDSREYIPSLLAIKEGTLLFGWDAVDCLDDPDVFLLRSMKRLSNQLRADDTVELAPGITLTMMEMMTHFLEHVKGMLIEYSNLVLERDRPIEVMVGVPANASTNQRYITLEAFKRAGFMTLGMMNEPSAAAVEFVHRYLRDLGPRSPKKYVVVYDLGGGTFDTSVVGLADRNFEVIATEGIAELGGDDFDQIILDQVLKASLVSWDRLSPHNTIHALEECRERKEGLKPTTRKMIVDLGPILGEDNPVVLETSAIYERCEPLIQLTLDRVQAVTSNVNRIGIDPADAQSLAAVYLVGGSISFPPVSRKIREVFGRKVKSSLFPHGATAIGLAIAADPGKRIRVSESVSRNFGVWREHEHGRDKIFDTIFKKGSRIKEEKGHRSISRIYHPMHNIGHLRFLECSTVGKAGEPQGDIALWDEIYFPYDPELKDRKDLSMISIEERHDLVGNEIVETYLYDAKGMIRITIENRTQGYRKVYTIGPAS